MYFSNISAEFSRQAYSELSQKAALPVDALWRTHWQMLNVKYVNVLRSTTNSSSSFLVHK